MKLSILVVKMDRDSKYCDYLLQSIKNTISLNAEEYEIVVYDNEGDHYTGSMSHGAGLTRGYKKTKGEFVLVLDPDTYFFEKGWDTELLQNFKQDPEIVLCGSVRCTSYETPFFYRPHFMGVRDSFYRDLILDKDGFLPQVSGNLTVNDVAFRITEFCIENNKKFFHYKNSLDDDLKKIYRFFGETIYNQNGVPFLHHTGRGSTKPERILDWVEFIENYRQ